LLLDYQILFCHGRNEKKLVVKHTALLSAIRCVDIYQIVI
jgi:hypothetical protein